MAQFIKLQIFIFILENIALDAKQSTLNCFANQFSSKAFPVYSKFDISLLLETLSFPIIVHIITFEDTTLCVYDLQISIDEATNL